MSLGADVALEVFKRGGGAIGMGVRALGFGKKLIRGATSVFRKAPKSRPGVGSVVTKGPLKIGGKIVYGSKPGMSTAAKVAIGAAGVGVGTVASHRSARVQRSPSAAPSRAASPSPAPSGARSDRKCCPAGTKRMVCYKRGRVKKEAKATTRARAYREKVRARAKKAKAKAKERAAAKRQRAATRRLKKALKRATRRR